ncbi:MAG: hypothetical protein J5I98_24975 [Phaeodactylibacter sp.]|nr:hypothetical protein [Phaeodactylibacter sp.]
MKLKHITILSISILLCGCFALSNFINQKSKEYVELTIDFHDSQTPLLSIPIEINSDSSFTAYDILKKSNLSIELDPKYNAPPSILLNRIENKPTSLEEDLFWAVFVEKDDSWVYQTKGIGEIRVFKGMKIGFSLSRWQYINDKFVPIFLPEDNQAIDAGPTSAGKHQIVSVSNRDDKKGAELNDDVREELAGCGGGTPFSGGSLKIGSYKISKNYFHRTIKPRILRDSPKFQHEVGRNPDVGIRNGTIRLNGTGPYKGKSFDTGLNPQNYFNQ